MPETFDPYHTWLGIPPDEQPPNHYRLLGIRPFESRPDVIESAVDRQMAHLRSYQASPHSELSQKLLNEVAAAKVCLTNPAKKGGYDAKLRATLIVAPPTPEDLERRRCERLLASLDEQDLLPAKLLESLRKQVAQSEKPVSAATVANRLVDLRHLTPEMAEQLLDAAESGMLMPRAASAPPSLVEEELSGSRGGAGTAAGMEPLDGLMAGSDLEAAAGGSPMIGTRRRGWRRLFPGSRKTGRKANQWDSSLMLVGGGTLLALVILLVVLVWGNLRQKDDETFQQATEQYRAGSYTNAISHYNDYLKSFPDGKHVGIARINRGLARMRQATSKGTRDWVPALKTAKEVLGEIAPEDQFSEAHGDLAAMLLSIGEGLAAQARQTPNPALVDRTNETIALMEKYVPKSLRRNDKIAEIQASLALAEREIRRGEELAKALVEMEQAVAQGDTKAAYQIRESLLKQYPRLADDDQLRRVTRGISRAERAAVEVVQKEQPAETAEVSGPIISTVVLARRSTKADVPGVAGQVVFALADGAAYGLDATTGKVLWRRFLGYGAGGRGGSFPPVPFSATAGSDVLLVDPVRGEGLRVEATTGQLRWRQVIGERFTAHCVIAGQRILVATSSGRLVTIEAASGRSTGYVQLPQSLSVAPAVDSQHSLIFQVADHSNLFVLTLADGQCRNVVHLGHEQSTITAAPVIAGGFLLVAINDRAKTSTMRVMSIEQTEEGVSLKPVQSLRLKGYVDTTPLVVGRRVLVTTDSGVVTILELGGTQTKTPLRSIAETPMAEQRNLIRYALMQGGHFWIADVQWTKYDIQASSSQLVPKWIADEGSAFEQPPVAIGQTIFNVRRKVGTPGTIVSAMKMDEPDRYWETHLAAPLVGELMLDGADGPFTAVTQLGGVFQVDTNASKEQTVLDEPATALDPPLRRPITGALRLEGGGLVLSTGEGSDEVEVVDLGAQQRRFRRVALPDALGCAPVAFAGGLLAPTKVGQVLLLDPRSGGKLVEPFQPPLQSGEQIAWSAPVVAKGNEIILADGRAKLYRLGLVQQPKPHLAALNQATLSQPIVSPLAVIDEVVCAVDAGGVLRVFALPKLTPIEDAEQVLDGRCDFGPRRVGQHVLLTTDDGRLLCLDSKGKTLWQTDLPYGPLAGTPLVGAPVADGVHLLLASVDGVVWRVDAATGRQLGTIETGRPLGTGPLLLRGRLLVGGRDGTLYFIEPPPAQ